MRSPTVILEHLQKHSTDESYKFERLYRNLYNEDFYLLALQNIYSHQGAMTPGIDGLTLDGYGQERIQRIICAIKDHSYQPSPVRREYIKKKSGKLRPLGISSSDDKLVEEIVKMLLESIFERTFSNSSHGFRPNRSCHTARLHVQHKFTGVKWFIEGDIKSYFDTIDHHILVQILRRRIQDESFIELIWKFLKAGYMERWEFHTTYSGIAQGSGISPILANIYLNELDKFIEAYKARFDKGTTRTFNREYCKYSSRYRRLVKKTNLNWNMYSAEEKAAAKREQKRLRDKFMQYPSKEAMDPSYRRIQYVRYADDFLLGVIGSKEDSEKIKADIGQFLKQRLKLQLSKEKTLITSGKSKARFLGYDITISRDNATKRVLGRGTVRAYSGAVKLYLPKDKWVGKLLSYNVLTIWNNPGEEERWKPRQRDDYIFLTPPDIVRRYNAQILGIYNYYRLAGNVSVLNKFRYVMEYSMYKTFAAKYQITVTKAKLKYTRNKEFRVPYHTTHGTKYAVFYNDGFRKTRKPAPEYADIIPEHSQKYRPKELYRRYKANKCELCGGQEHSVKVFQVKSMTELKDTTPWGAVMLKRNRKTLVVCLDCYKTIHL